MFSILYPQIQYQPGSFVGSTIDSRIPTSFSSTGGMIMEGALFVNSINDIKDSDIASREMGYTGGPLKGITTRQIPGGPRLYKKNAPGVVFIANLDLSSFGSGSIISDDGDIITNWHVVEGNEKMLVWFYDKNITKIQSLGENTTVADVIGVDRERDLALLKIQTEKYELTPLALGEEYRLEVAQDVFAIGHPETQIWTFSYGVVSQLRDNYKWGYSADEKHVVKIMKEAEAIEKDSNQILNFTREIKNINEDEKKIIIEALWNIIYSDEDADIYETNLMRRLSGLLYLDNKVVGDIKEKVRLKK